MPQESFDFVIPLYRCRWNTRAVLEGLTLHYAPRAIHVITPAPEVPPLREQAAAWPIAPLVVHAEELFFQPQGLDKAAICAELDLGASLYTPGWFYQQLLKLGAAAGIDGLSEWYVVWDSDLLPVATWPLLTEQAAGWQYTFALLQHNQWGNASIVAQWAQWIRTVLAVEPLTDAAGTFTTHHMWFKQAHLRSLQRRIQEYFQSDDHWLRLMMRSANQFGTFGEYWLYASWVAAQAPEDLAFHPYARYGATTERFFDDGTALFSTALRQHLGVMPAADPAAERFSPTYAEVESFIRATYRREPLPSSLSFESSPRHLKKGTENMHIEEQRSRWHPLNVV